MLTFRLAAGKTFPPRRIMTCGCACKADGIDVYRMRAFVS